VEGFCGHRGRERPGIFWVAERLSAWQDTFCSRSQFSITEPAVCLYWAFRRWWVRIPAGTSACHSSSQSCQESSGTMTRPFYHDWVLPSYLQSIRRQSSPHSTLCSPDGDKRCYKSHDLLSTPCGLGNVSDLGSSLDIKSNKLQVWPAADGNNWGCAAYPLVAIKREMFHWRKTKSWNLRRLHLKLFELCLYLFMA
jgi:hypothetical protein